MWLHPNHFVSCITDVYTDAYFNGTMHRQTGGKIGYPASFSNVMSSHRTTYYKSYVEQLSRLLNHEAYQRPRVLDFGCGYGNFLRVLHDRISDVEVHGIEVDPTVRDRASSNLGGAPVYCVDLKQDNNTVPRNYFDVITLLDVIEHLDDPYQYLRNLAEYARPQGYLLLSTPNIESLNARIYRDNWVLHSPPLHMYYFGPRSLSILLARAGWQLTDFWTECTIFHNERHGMETWRGKLARFMFQNRISDVLTNRVIRIGSIMTVIARRSQLIK